MEWCLLSVRYKYSLIVSDMYLVVLTVNRHNNYMIAQRDVYPYSKLKICINLTPQYIRVQYPIKLRF
jgi:hypothetical protein